MLLPTLGVTSFASLMSDLKKAIIRFKRPLIQQLQTTGAPIKLLGLLFRSHDDPAHPNLLGQWTGSGPIFDIKEDEWIVDFIFKTTKPRRKVMARLALSQVTSITLVTVAHLPTLGTQHRVLRSAVQLSWYGG